MMVEDKLSRDERLRLECVAQAVAYSQMKQVIPRDIVSAAKEFEEYISGGRDKVAESAV